MPKEAEKKYTKADLQEAVRKALKTQAVSIRNRLEGRLFLYKQTHLPLLSIQFASLSEALNDKVDERVPSAMVIIFSIISFKGIIKQPPRRKEIHSMLGHVIQPNVLSLRLKTLRDLDLVYIEEKKYYVTDLGQQVLRSFSIKAAKYEHKLGVKYVDLRLTYWKNRAHLLWFTLDKMFNKDNKL